MRRPILVVVSILAGCGGGWRGVHSQDGTERGGSGATVDVVPLTNRTLVFARDGEIHTVDVETGERTYVARVGAPIDSLALSPNRRTIAFASMADFDAVRYPLDKGIPTQSIRTIAVDGTRGRQVLAPIADADAAVRCDADMTCTPLGLVCDTNIRRCTAPLRTRSVSELAWSEDGASIWFALADHRWEGARFAGGTRIGRVSELGGAPELFDVGAGCAQVTSPAASAQGLLTIRSVCEETNTKIAVRDAVVLTEADLDFSIDLADAEWLPDGSGFAFGAYGGTFATNAVVVFVLATRELRVLFDAGPGRWIDSFDVSPDGAHLALGLSASNPNGRNLQDVFVADIRESNPRAVPLTSDGSSRLPTW